jgi:short-subunit dehydrogenase
MENTKLVDGRTLPGAALVAKAGYQAMHRGDAVEVVGLSNKVLASSGRFTPRPVMRRLAHRMQEAGH